MAHQISWASSRGKSFKEGFLGSSDLKNLDKIRWMEKIIPIQSGKINLDPLGASIVAHLLFIYFQDSNWGGEGHGETNERFSLGYGGREGMSFGEMGGCCQT